MTNLLGVRSGLTSLQRAILWWAVDNAGYHKAAPSWDLKDVPPHIWLGNAETVIATINNAEQRHGLNDDAKQLRERLIEHVAKNKRTSRENAV